MAGKKTPLKIIPLGGLDGIGKNMTVFEYGNDMVLVDAGLMFPDDEQLGIDLVLPDYTYVLENEHKLRGIIITHGHEDHTGALPYLLMDLQHKVPIFSSSLTLGFIEGKLNEHRIHSSERRLLREGNLTFHLLGAFLIQKKAGLSSLRDDSRKQDAIFSDIRMGNKTTDLQIMNTCYLWIPVQ